MKVNAVYREICQWILKCTQNRELGTHLLVQNIEKVTGVLFIENLGDLNVCQLGSEEVRHEYRTFITSEELMFYILATCLSNADRVPFEQHLKYDFNNIPFPTDPANFWNHVDLGKKLSKKPFD